MIVEAQPKSFRSASTTLNRKNNPKSELPAASRRVLYRCLMFIILMRWGELGSMYPYMDHVMNKYFVIAACRPLSVFIPGAWFNFLNTMRTQALVYTCIHSLLWMHTRTLYLYEHLRETESAYHLEILRNHCRRLVADGNISSHWTRIVGNRKINSE